MSSSRDKFTLLSQNSVTDVSVGFRPPCWRPSRWAPTWRLHTNLYKFGENISPHIFHKKNSCDLNLGEGLCISTFFLFPDSRLNLLNGFEFLFWSILNGVTLKTSNKWAFVSLTHSTSVLCVGDLFSYFFRNWIKTTKPVQHYLSRAYRLSYGWLGISQSVKLEL